MKKVILIINKYVSGNTPKGSQGESLKISNISWICEIFHALYLKSELEFK